MLELLEMLEVRTAAERLRSILFPMQNEFTSVIEQHGEWFVGFCPEIPEANGHVRIVCRILPKR
jgi:hypothetical protein